MDKERSEKIQSERTKITEAVNNVYKLPLTVTAIQYLHAAGGFPTKATWIKEYKQGTMQRGPS